MLFFSSRQNLGGNNFKQRNLRLRFFATNKAIIWYEFLQCDWQSKLCSRKMSRSWPWIFVFSKIYIYPDLSLSLIFFHMSWILTVKEVSQGRCYTDMNLEKRCQITILCIANNDTLSQTLEGSFIDILNYF